MSRALTAKRTALPDDARDPEAKERHQRHLTRLKLATQIARLRREAGLSQAELALRIGTQQAAVARMERSTYRGYTVGTLAKIAAAAGARLEVRLVPRPVRGVAARSSNGSRLHGGRG